jgi:CheY-like chemotaxis protein
MEHHLGERSILVVDDDEAIATCMEAILSEEGYPVVAVRDARRALELVRGGAPGLILLDYRMPGMSAGAFLAALREEGRAGIPVALLTAAREGPELAHELGVSRFLPKPFELTALLNLVSDVLGGPVDPPQPSQPATP